MEFYCNYKLINLPFAPEMPKKKGHKERGSIYQKNRKTQYGTKANFSLVFHLYRGNYVKIHGYFMQKMPLT